MQFDIDKVGRECQTEERGEDSDEIDEEARRLKIPRVDLFACSPVANQSGHTN